MSNKKQSALQSAEDWLIALSDSDKSSFDEHAFRDWLNASPQNADQFLQQQAIWLGVPQAAQGIDVDALLTQLSPIKEFPQNDAGVSVNASQYDELIKPRNRAWTWLSAAASVVIVVAVVVLYRFDNQPIVQEHLTALGEMRQIGLEDGSQMHLNTRSNVEVTFEKHYRLAQIFQGEAFFDITPDPDRPFFIDSQGTLVRVLGTKFNVRLYPDKTVVSVLEGSVSVSRGAFTSAGVKVGDYTLISSDQAVVPLSEAQAEVVLKRGIDINQVLAWTENRMVFKDDTLSEIISEFNRYIDVPLVFEDDAIGQLKMTGVFSTDDTDAFLAVLSQTMSLQWHYNALDSKIILSRSERY